MSRQELYS